MSLKITRFFNAAIMVMLVFLFASCEKDDPSPQYDNLDGKLKFMVLSDFHFMHPALLIKDGKAFKDYNDEECKLLVESGALLNAAIERIKAYHPAFIIVCGDMSKDGEIISHEYVANLFAKLERETGTKVLVVPGNHDLDNPHSFYYDGNKTIPAPTASEAQFAQIYAECGYDEAVERRPSSLDYMAYPAEGIAFIGVNSNEPNTADNLIVQGGLSREQVEWIKEMARKAHSEGRYVLMSMHHNLVDFYDNAQLIRGSDIANARYDYDNASLINDLCSAGIDVVFSGHSHMQSITSATHDSHTIYSVITSSLVNLPLAYRKGTIDNDGKLSLWSENLKKCWIPGVDNLEAKGDKYWHDLSAYYMKTAANEAWNAAGDIIRATLDFEDRDELEAFLKDRFEGVFYNFLLRTSEGNEHFFSPQKNYDDADAAIQGLLDFFDEKGATGLINLASSMLLDASLDDVHSKLRAFFHSAYFNYLGTHPTMPDDWLEIQLTNK